MPQKTLNLLLAVAGLAIVAAFAVLGYDLYRAACTGPRWKRRLVAAGLAVLAMLGIPACEETTQAGDPPAPTAAPARTLAEAREWKRLTATWREAEEVASGKRGAYPFDRKGKEKLLADLKQAEADVAALQTAGLVTAPEAGLLAADLAQLTRGVQGKRPTEMKMATCYKPMMVIPARDSMGRLAARLPLLRQLVDGDKLHPDVARKVLVSVEADLAILANKEMTGRLPETDRPKAEELRKPSPSRSSGSRPGSRARRSTRRSRARAVAEQVVRLKARLAGKTLDEALESADDWRIIADAWAAAMPLATSRRSTTAQRKAADAKLKAANAAATRLVDAGLLASQEADLLVGEAANIRADIYRDPPTDCKMTCYDMAYIPPAQQSFRRLAKRLPLIEQLAAGPKLNRAVFVRIAAAVEADIAVLSEDKRLQALPEAERKQAATTREKARLIVDRLRLRLDPRGGTCYYATPQVSTAPQSPQRLDERLRRIDALERQGTLQPSVAHKAREAVRRQRAEAEGQ